MSSKKDPATFSGQRRAVLGQLAALTAAAAIPMQSFGQSYPSRAIRLVVPFPPGGGFDSVARPLAQKMASILKATIVVDNKAGAAGNIGTSEVGRAAPDGYTILFANEILSTNPYVYKTIGFDALKDFEPIATIATTPLALAVAPDLPARNLKELIALSAKEPITYGTPGRGTSPHLFGELLNLQTPLKMRHIPYRGTGPAITDAIGGQINAVLSTASSIAQHIKSGKLRGIAILSNKRSAMLPDLPTLAEAGIPGHSHDVWYVMLAPAGTPQPIVAQLREAALQALRERDLEERLRTLGFDLTPGDGKMVTELIRRDLTRWGKVVAEANIIKE
jgi:tripartite-type tricarboxylate transporter receptor subunit TctC